MSSHALLSASASHRWMHCPPSARLGENYEDRTSDFAMEGTEAHALCEYHLKTALAMAVDDPRGNMTYYSQEMENCAAGYATYIMDLFVVAKQECKDPLIFIEQRLDYSRFVAEGFGTGDCVIIADGTLEIIDYKHGKGFLVEADNNPQMMLYALGACELLDGIYDIETIRMTIYQPRRENISTYTISKAELYQWAEDILKPAAIEAYAGAGNYQCGEWCRFCKAKYECRERAQANMQLAQYEFRKPPLLEDDEVATILSQVDDLIAWVGDIKDHALQQAISGKHWTGWKLVEGRANRKYINEHQVIETVTKAGYDPYEQKLLGITAMQKLLGKSTFDELLSSQIEKPQGKPTLVPESDKRPEINNAQHDFYEEN